MPFIYYKEEMDARQSFVFFTAQALLKIERLLCITISAGRSRSVKKSGDKHQKALISARYCFIYCSFLFSPSPRSPDSLFSSDFSSG
jgi:hypothetical protein